MSEKPFKGKIEKWVRMRLPTCHGLGFIIWGTFLDHPDFAGEGGHTSVVMSERKTDNGIEIETRNSRYLLVGDEFFPDIFPTLPSIN